MKGKTMRRRESNRHYANKNEKKEQETMHKN